MNTIENNFQQTKKGSLVSVGIEANLKAQKTLLDTKSKTGSVIHLKHFYSRLIEHAINNPSIVKATIQSFTKPKQVA